MKNKSMQNSAQRINHILNIKYVSISMLKPALYNARVWDDSAISQLTDSINKFGLVDPIIVNGSPKRKNIVIGGHFRLKVAKDLGYKKIPVVYLNIPDIKKEKALNIRLNKNVGDWDFEKLKSFDLDLLLDTGFDAVDLNLKWNIEIEDPKDDFDLDKEISKIKTTIIRTGDLILLGKHRLVCGNCNDQNTIKRLCGDNNPSMIYNDPPFNLNIDYNRGIGGKQNYGGCVNDNLSFTEYKDFLSKSLINALSVCKKDVHIFYWCDQIYIGLIQELYRENNIENKRVCLWIKGSHYPTPNIAFNKCYEPAVYGIKGKPHITRGINNLNEVMDKNFGTGNELLDKLDTWLIKRIPGKDYEHATSKPPTLYEKAIRRCTKVGDIILDCFLGSGSTLIAAEMLNRIVYGCEKEPVFCDLIVRRYEKLTGKKAKIIHHEKD